MLSGFFLSCESLGFGPLLRQCKIFYKILSMEVCDFLSFSGPTNQLISQEYNGHDNLIVK